LRAHHIARLVLAALMTITTLVPQTLPVAAASERTLYLYYTHTKETARITFKRNGQYVQSGLRELNQFLRDWRRDEPAKMDPRLFDLVWEVYQEVDATQPIYIVSAYRAPETNAMLRSRSSGVAENSKHIDGQAMDFYIPGVPLNKLRAVAMRKQVGGVGYYPTSGSPFVHLDTGNVRAWPRMTRAQLEEIFPDGKTLHIPPSGKPLSQRGYQLARAEWQRCHRVPCGGSSNFAVASNDGGSGGTLMDLFFGGDDEETTPAPVQVASAPQQPQEPAGSKIAPVPMMRPQMALALAEAEGPASIPFSTTGSAPLTPELMTASLAPVPARKSETLVAETTGETAVMAIASLDAPPIPAPRLHMTNPPEQAETVLTAYAAPTLRNAGSQQALERIIETAMVPPLPNESAEPQLRLEGISQMQTASIGGGAPGTPNLLEMTWGAMGQQPEPEPVAQALAELVDSESGAGSIDTRDARLIAPDLEHVAATMVAPVPVSSPHFAVIFEHDEADFDPATELGPHVPEMSIGDEPPTFSAKHFTRTPLVVAAR
jgi:uncharacterized protein YcbK (DUF882 family)